MKLIIQCSCYVRVLISKVISQNIFNGYEGQIMWYHLKFPWSLIYILYGVIEILTMHIHDGGILTMHIHDGRIVSINFKEQIMLHGARFHFLIIIHGSIIDHLFTNISPQNWIRSVIWLSRKAWLVNGDTIFTC